MLGVVFKGGRRIALERFPDPTPGPQQVVVEIKASGMCGSDLHAYRKATGKSDKIIGGHEPSGVIAALGPGVAGGAVRVGARVMVHHYHGCTTCEHCRSGWAQLCTNDETEIYGVNRNGAHARYMLVPADTLVPLDDRLSFAAGAAISCGTGTAWGALKRMGLSGRDTIAIFGQGPVGSRRRSLPPRRGRGLLRSTSSRRVWQGPRRSAPRRRSTRARAASRIRFGS